MRYIATLIFIISFLLFVVPINIFAAAAIDRKEATVSAATSINSFEYFYPISAGRTMGDSLYPLKELKENLRGLFIFSVPQKVEYKLSLVTKRLVEAESLININNNDSAVKTLLKAQDNLSKMILEYDSLKEENEKNAVRSVAQDKLARILTFITWLSQKNNLTENVKLQLEQTKGKTEVLLNKF